MAIGYGGQYVAVYPDRDLVIGIHSSINNDQSYQSQLFEYLHYQIPALFNADQR